MTGPGVAAGHEPRQRGLQQSAAQREVWDNKMPFPAIRALAAGSFGFFFFCKKNVCLTFLAFCQDDVKGKQSCWSRNQTQRFPFSGSLQGLLEKNFPSHSSSFFLPGKKQKMQRGFQETFLSLGCSQRNTTIFHMEEI